MTSNITNDSNNKINIIDAFKKISDKNPKNESNTELLERNLGQNAARAAETYIGMPGNLKKGFKQSRDYFTELFGLPNFSEMEEKTFGKPEKGSYEDLIFNPPTSSELRETATKNISKKITGNEEYLEPKNEKEKALGEFTQDLSSFFMPGTGQLRMAVRLGAPIVGNLIKQGTKYLGGTEEQAEKIKSGIMLATTLAGQLNPGQFAQNQIQQSRQMVPQNTTVQVGNLAERFLPLYNRLQRGLGVPSKSRTMQGMQDLAGQVRNNRMPLQSLMDARNDVNEWIAEAGGWDIPVSVRDRTLRNLNEFKTSIIQTIDENLQNRFPEAAEMYRNGYQAAAVNHQSNAISNFIERNFGRKVNSVAAKVLFPGLAGGAAILPKTAAVGAAAFPLYKAGQILYRVGNSPTLAMYYQDVIQQSLRGNAPAMIKSLDKLDKELLKDEKKNKKNEKPNLEDFKNKFKKKG